MAEKKKFTCSYFVVDAWGAQKPISFASNNVLPHTKSRHRTLREAKAAARELTEEYARIDEPNTVRVARVCLPRGSGGQRKDKWMTHCKSQPRDPIYRKGKRPIFRKAVCNPGRGTGR